MIGRRGNTVLMVLLLAGLAGGCSEKTKNPVGFGLWDEEGHWQVHQLVNQDVTADSSFHAEIGSGIGPYLLMGSWEGQAARSLMSFEEDLPDTLDRPLTEVSLNMVAYSEVSEDSILISVYPLESPWSDSSATWEVPWTTAGGDYSAEPIGEGYFATEDGLEFQIEFNTAGVELVQGWLDGGPNYGLLLKSDELEEDHLKYFYSEDTPYFPYLQMIFADEDEADTVIVDSEKDTFIAEPVDPPGEDLLLVSDGHVTRSWLQFDLAAVPESSFINLARLSLTVSEFHDPLDNMSLRAYPVSDLQTLSYETSSYGSASLYSGKESVDLDITGMVQDWVTGTENLGILLRTYLEHSSISQALFLTSSADSAQRPTLEVVYTARPEDITAVERTRVAR